MRAVLDGSTPLILRVLTGFRGPILRTLPAFAVFCGSVFEGLGYEKWAVVLSIVLPMNALIGL